MKKTLIGFAAIILSISSISFATTQTNKQETEKPTTTIEKAIEKGTLLFFLNPNGAPCQRQAKILKQSMEQISTKADVSYISTTDPMSRFSFSRYGIRSLPSLVLLDANGNVSKHFPPGIRSVDEITSALNELK